MLAARLGAWLRNTGEKWARTSFAEKLALLLALLAVVYTVVTGAAELRYQARAREALAQVKAARLAAGAVSAQCYSAISCAAPRRISRISAVATRPRARTALPTAWPRRSRHWAHCPAA